MSRASRTGVVAVLLLAIVASVFARRAALSHRRQTASSPAAGAAGSSLSSMNSYALALLLGGLRGPLVMFLWPSAESQKSERNLADFDTKIEWIRLLQAEFDTVHIFQIWNKAYNISVQMANVANKYTTILDALDYAHKVDRERPNNINILAAVGQIYFDKFGTSQSANFYKARIRAESLPHAAKQKLKPGDAGWRRLELDPVLDPNGNVLPEYLKPGTIRLVDARNGDVYDGSDLQFVARFGPYPFGLSPYGLAYNYYKRSQILQETGKQRHAQLSDLVIDSRPALSLKNWAEDEQRFARRQELMALGKPPVEDDVMLDVPSANLPLDASFPTDKRANLSAAIESYDLATRLVAAAEAEYARHTAPDRYPTNLLLYRQHREGLAALEVMSRADRDYLKAVGEPNPAKQKELLAAAAEAYEAGISAYNAIIMRYYVPLELLQQLVPGASREALDQMPPPQRTLVVAEIVKRVQAGEMSESAEDIGEAVRPIARAEARLKLIGR